VSIRKPTIQGLIGWLKMEGAKCKLHPLIHTLLDFNLAQDVASIKSGAEASLMLFDN
jgi:hypothetical protein